MFLKKGTSISIFFEEPIFISMVHQWSVSLSTCLFDWFSKNIKCLQTCSDLVYNSINPLFSLLGQYSLSYINVVLKKVGGSLKKILLSAFKISSHHKNSTHIRLFTALT